MSHWLRAGSYDLAPEIRRVGGLEGRQGRARGQPTLQPPV